MRHNPEPTGDRSRLASIFHRLNWSWWRGGWRNKGCYMVRTRHDPPVQYRVPMHDLAAFEKAAMDGGDLSRWLEDDA
jgi:hypothetical protein